MADQLTSNTEKKSYSSSQEHLDDYIELVRLLLTRYLQRYWYRLTASDGKINDLFVSLEEITYVLADGEHSKIPEVVGLTPLDELDTKIIEHRTSMFDRLGKSVHQDILFPAADLQDILGLDTMEMDILMVLFALQVNVALHRIATFAWADFTVKRPTVGFLAEVVSSDREEHMRAMQFATPAHLLRILRIVEFGEDEHWGKNTPALFQNVKLSNRVTTYLLGSESFPVPKFHKEADYDNIDLFCSRHTQPISLEEMGQPQELENWFINVSRNSLRLKTMSKTGLTVSEKVPIIYLTGSEGLSYGKIVKAVVGHQPVVEINVISGLAGGSLSMGRVEEVIALGLRESALLQAIPVINMGKLIEEDTAKWTVLPVLQRLLTLSRQLIVLTSDTITAEVRQALGPFPEIMLRVPSVEHRLKLWTKALSNHIKRQPELKTAVGDLAYQYILTPQIITNAARNAELQARLRSSGKRGFVPISAKDIKTAIRHQVDHKLLTLAEPFSTTLTWDDIVLDEKLLHRLQDMIAFAKNKQQVRMDWGFHRLDGYGQGLTALFSGPSGTGKTLASAIVARELGCELYRVDLSQLINKYIGETEKNLARVFDEAERGKAILLFDEADSLFGKRTGVKSSQDRWANMGVNYLLQRMEHFSGTSILTTNLEKSMDEAFQRRLKFRLQFSIPNVEQRKTIWQKMIPEQAPIEEYIDWEELAEEFEMAPGNIKNTVMRAAYQAAKTKEIIDYEMLRDAAIVEYRDIGKLISD